MNKNSEIQKQWQSSDLYRKLIAEMQRKLKANERLNPLLQRLSLGLDLTPQMIEFAQMQRSSVNDLQLSDVLQTLTKKVQASAESIYGESWNFYSGALSPVAANIFEESVSALLGDYEDIDYLEIGSCQGLSMSLVACLLKYHTKLGKCVSIDPYFDDGYVEGANSVWEVEREISINKNTRDNAQALYKKLHLDVEHLEKTSTEGLRSLIQQEERFHLIYIDGSHEKMMPLRDLGLSFEVLYSGGIIMLDDHNWPDVKPLKELCDKHCEPIAESWKISAYRVP